MNANNRIIREGNSVMSRQMVQSKFKDKDELIFIF